MIDANTVALRRYEEKQAKAERQYEKFVKALEEEVFPIWDEAYEKFAEVARRYDIDADFCEEMKNF